MSHPVLRAAALAAVVSAACSAPDASAPTDVPRARPTPTARRAAPPVPEPVASYTSDDLSAAVRHALENSAEVRAAHAEWARHAERIEQAEALPRPLLAYGEFLEELETRAGPQRRRIGLTQAFPWPGTLSARARVAERRAHAAWHRLEAARLDVVEHVVRAHHEYAFLGRRLAIRRELLDLLSELETLVRARVRTGAGHEELLRLQVEMGRLEDDVRSDERRLPVLSARLADALGLPPGAPTLPVPSLEVPDTASFDVGALVDRVLAHNPTLAGLDAERAASSAAEEVADLDARPGFTVGVDYLDTGSALAPGTPDSGDDPVLLRVGVGLPLWTSADAAARREARRATDAATARLVDAESRLAVEATDAAFAVEDATRRVALYRESLVPRARSALELTAASYRTGGASIVDLIDAERVVLEFELASWAACRDALVGRARLERLTAEVVR